MSKPKKPEPKPTPSERPPEKPAKGAVLGLCVTCGHPAESGVACEVDGTVAP